MSRRPAPSSCMPNLSSPQRRQRSRSNRAVHKVPAIALAHSRCGSGIASSRILRVSINRPTGRRSGLGLCHGVIAAHPGVNGAHRWKWLSVGVRHFLWRRSRRLDDRAFPSETCRSTALAGGRCYPLLTRGPCRVTGHRHGARLRIPALVTVGHPCAEPKKNNSPDSAEARRRTVCGATVGRVIECVRTLYRREVLRVLSQRVRFAGG